MQEDGGGGEWEDDDVREAVFVMTCSDVMDYCRKVGQLEGSKTRGSLPKKLVHLCVGVCEDGCVGGCACVWCVGQWVVVCVGGWCYVRGQLYTSGVLTST